MSVHRHIKTAVITMTALLAYAGTVQAETVVKIAAEDPGGSWYSYSATFSRIIEQATKGEIKAEIVPRGGGIANPSLVNLDKADFGFTTSNAAAWARDGLDAVYHGKKHDNLRGMIGGMQFAYTMVIANRDYVKKNNIKVLDDLFTNKVAPRFVVKPNGSQVPLIADVAFQTFGTDLVKLRASKQLTQVSPSQIAQLVRDSTVDVYFENAPAKQATVTEVTMTNDMAFVPFSDKTLKTLAGYGMPTMTMPANTFKGQTEDYKTAVSSTIMVTNKDVPDAVVYKVTKALVENMEAIQKEHAPLQVWNPEKGAQLDQSILPLHPGAAKYYRERGWIK
ncbi:MAG: TAXI family TRAP transporter solute-binding subunit [Formivibrio sp.]|nr:TAXI family TRAP transporter solute-binding subunit [Formivibrio sp.]